MELIEQIQRACEQFGFFQLINHEVRPSLQEQVIKQCKELFNLPLEVKEKYGKGTDFNLSFPMPNSGRSNLLKLKRYWRL